MLLSSNTQCHAIFLYGMTSLRNEALYPPIRIQKKAKYLVFDRIHAVCVPNAVAVPGDARGGRGGWGRRRGRGRVQRAAAVRGGAGAVGARRQRAPARAPALRLRGHAPAPRAQLRPTRESSCPARASAGSPRACTPECVHVHLCA